MAAAAKAKEPVHQATSIHPEPTGASSAMQRLGAIPNAIASDRLSSCMPIARSPALRTNMRANRPSNVSAITATAISAPAWEAPPRNAAAMAAIDASSDT